ncbi:MAG TPA: biotin--[acetyl-CoA-carboxylase] ligase [Chitinophagaceae bacterium]|nr:biotin--[acetyl-CoA-carboxylase] ligase [Chitinophagaceae bacterium]
MPIGEPLVILPSVDSTNKYAMEQVHAHMAKHGTAYFAMEQTQGKGQRGKTWVTNAGENIIVSIVTSPQCPFSPQPFIFNAAIALACYDFYKYMAGEDSSIKWPNDIYWRDRKAGGILIENMVNGSSWNWSIIGIGINVNQVKFDPSIPNPVSLRQIRGEILDPLALTRELLASIEKYWNQWKSDPGQLLETYNSILYRRGQQAKFRTGNRVFEGTVKQVNGDGELVVVTAMEERFKFGEITWLH